MIRVLAAMGVLLALAGCGKVGGTTQPGPADQITYPKIYPTH